MNADIRYHKKAIRNFMIAVNRNTEPELIDWLESKENVNGYIKWLVKDDMIKSKEGND